LSSNATSLAPATCNKLIGLSFKQNYTDCH
jgi:hypothetical protein